MDIYIKDKAGKLIWCESIKEEENLFYQKALALKEQTVKLTIILRSSSGRVSPQWSAKDIQIFHQVVEIVSNNLSHCFSIEELAAQVGMNRTRLQAGFKNTFHKTINSFTQDLKMERARDWISENRGYSLKEIARMLGYRHSNHFSVAFKKKFNISPSAFRNAGQG